MEPKADRRSWLKTVGAAGAGVVVGAVGGYLGAGGIGGAPAPSPTGVATSTVTSTLTVEKWAPKKATFAYLSPGTLDIGWSLNTWKSVQWIPKKYPSIDVSIKEGVAPEDILPLTEGLIEKGAGIVFVDEEFVGLKLAEIYEKHPNVYFFPEFVGSMTPIGRNLIRGNGREYQGFYLGGMVAGGLTKKGAVGVVCSMPVPINFVRLNAITMGVRAVRPDAKVYIVWVGSWYDPAAEGEVATTLIRDYGCDVLTQITDSNVPVRTAKTEGVWFLGKSLDFVDAGWGTEETVATSFVFHWEPIFDQIVKDYLVGNQNPQNLYYPGMAQPLWTPNGDVTITDLEMKGKRGIDAISPRALEQISPAVIDTIEKRRRLLMIGAWDPFLGELRDRQGNVRSPEGDMPTINEILAMDYLIEGIVGAER